MFHDKRLVVIIMVMAVSSTLISQQLSGILQVYASESSPYDSGYDHGCDDAGRSESDKYINQPEREGLLFILTLSWMGIMQD
jgi:hypothetical protein